MRAEYVARLERKKDSGLRVVRSIISTLNESRPKLFENLYGETQRVRMENFGAGQYRFGEVIVDIRCPANSPEATVTFDGEEGLAMRAKESLLETVEGLRLD